MLEKLPQLPAGAQLQVTAVFDVPVTVAVNCWVAPTATVAAVGATDTATGVLTVTVAVAVLLVSACEVAVMVTVLGLGAVAGAV